LAISTVAAQECCSYIGTWATNGETSGTASDDTVQYSVESASFVFTEDPESGNGSQFGSLTVTATGVAVSSDTVSVTDCTFSATDGFWLREAVESQCEFVHTQCDEQSTGSQTAPTCSSSCDQLQDIADLFGEEIGDEVTHEFNEDCTQVTLGDFVLFKQEETTTVPTTTTTPDGTTVPTSTTPTTTEPTTTTTTLPANGLVGTCPGIICQDTTGWSSYTLILTDDFGSFNCGDYLDRLAAATDVDVSVDHCMNDLEQGSTVVEAAFKNEADRESLIRRIDNGDPAFASWNIESYHRGIDPSSASTMSTSIVATMIVLVVAMYFGQF